MVRALLCVLIVLLIPFTAAGISRYVDENGRLVFVDDESKVPARYLEQAESLDTLAEPTEQEKAEQAERLRRARDVKQEETQRQREERSEQERQKAYETPVEIRGNRILVPVQVTYRGSRVDLLLLLDTGATGTVLHRRGLGALGLAPDEGIASYGVGAGGNKIATRKIVFTSIAIGPFKAEQASAFVIDYREPRADYDGLLGMDFLRYLSYEIDYGRQVIRWQP